MKDRRPLQHPTSRVRPARFVHAAAALLWAATCASGAATIFDDDWAPPRRAGPAGVQPAGHPAAATENPPAPPPGPGEAPAPATPVKPPTPPPGEAPAAASGGAGRRAVPGPADQDKSRKLMKDVFAKELNDHSAGARKALARRLLDESARLSDTPSDLYVVLGGAIRSAVDAGDLPLALGAADRMAASFDVDGLGVKAAAALKMQPRAYAADPAANVKAGLELLDPLESAEDFAAASRLTALLQQVPVADPALRAALPARAREIDEARAARDRLGPAVEKLKTAPNDPAASGAVGRYTALVRDDWEHGLPLLAKGDDPALASLAARDLAGAKDADAMLKLGDGWSDYGSRHHAFSRGCTARARFWCMAALKEAKGLARVAVMKKLVSLPPGADFAILKELWGETETTEISSGVNNDQNDLPPSPGLFTGIEYTTAGWSGRDIIHAMRPVFLTADGRAVGGVHGASLDEKRAKVIEARPGYAVGAVAVEGSDRVYAMCLRFMRVHGAVLDPSDAYDSPWVGNPVEKNVKTFGGDGRAVVGVCCRHGADLEGVGLIQLK